MIINSTLIFCLVPELNSRLSGGRVEKIRQSEDGKRILISIRKESRMIHFFYSSDPVNCRVELWSPKDLETVKDEFSDTRLFQRILRSKIVGVDQIDFDRVIRITCLRRTELERQKELDLVFEMTGRNTNLILVDKKDSTILDCLRKIDPARSRYRQIAPGLKYLLPPPPKKKNPLEASESEFKKSLSQKSGTDISTFLQNSYSGMDRLLAQEIILDSAVSGDKEISELTDTEKEDIFRSFQKTSEKIRGRKINPHIIFDDKGNPIAISPFDLDFIAGELKQSHRSLNSTTKEFFKLRIEKERESVK